jgi:soluble lytic murein transglycosylase-like protein
MVRGTAGRYLKILLCAAVVATAQSYVAAPSYGKNATDADWHQPAPAGNSLAAPALCLAAVQAAEYRHGIPRGLLLAIAEVETGRPLAEGGGRVPWPWSANADNQSYFFATRQDAVAWTIQALRHGTASIDSGCMQVNLAQHPDAFASVNEAFDPARNADYAARYLIQLYRETGDWRIAVGWYHSHTPTLADPYRDRVAAAFAEAVMHRRAQILVEMAAAWDATRAGPPGACPASGARNDAIGSAALRFDNSCGVH